MRCSTFNGIALCLSLWLTAALITWAREDSKHKTPTDLVFTYNLWVSPGVGRKKLYLIDRTMLAQWTSISRRQALGSSSNKISGASGNLWSLQLTLFQGTGTRDGRGNVGVKRDCPWKLSDCSLFCLSCPWNSQRGSSCLWSTWYNAWHQKVLSVYMLNR